MNKAAGDLACTDMEQWCASSLQSSGGWEASFAPGQPSQKQACAVSPHPLLRTVKHVGEAFLDSGTDRHCIGCFTLIGLLI